MTQPRILAKVSRDEFIGRDAELRNIVSQASRVTDARGLVVLSAPGVGASELLRQSYDQLFARRGNPVPIHFAFQPGDLAPIDTARRFFQNFLQQYVAYRRVDPALCEAPLNFRDLAELALPADYEFINNLIETFDREDASAEPRDLVRFCFNVPHRVTSEGRSVYCLIDCLALRPFREEMLLGHDVAMALGRSGSPFALGGLRRQVVDLIHGDDGGRDVDEIIHLDRISDDDARRVLEVFARRYEIETNEPTRDLIVQQLNASPFFIDEFLQAAREARTQLVSFLDCQRLYVNELMGGRLKRHFDRILEGITPNPQTEKALLRVLFESTAAEARKSSLWAWKKRLGVDASEFERIIDALHVCELVNSSAAFIEVNTESSVWMDYLRTQYQMEVVGEARAKVVAEILLETLKRAPQTMAHKYRREAALGLRDLISQFNCQSVPAILFHYDRFATTYRGEDIDSIDTGLEAEADLIRLPQIVQAAACSAYSSTISCEAERCAVAHGFEAAEYTDQNEIVWLVAEIDSKLEANRELTEEWCNRLSNLARECGFGSVRLWLVAPEGFSEQACKLLDERKALGSSRQQVELLAARIKSDARAVSPGKADEYEMIIPMGAETELIAARTVEQIARRVNFRPEAINQIKTALVEACINAAEHSLSPDRKIYQRFVLEDDKLVVTVASRGVVPAALSGHNGQDAAIDQMQNPKSRRGWGLKLIKTLMDEVEFERVDDGTQLRMTKYIRK